MKIEVKNHIPIQTWMSMNEAEEWQVIEHAKKIAILPWAYHHVAVMADGHRGIGPSIGSVIALKDAVSPSSVGVDIGCGMAAVKYNLRAEDLPHNLSELRSKIEEAIPVGFNSRNSTLTFVKKHELWSRFRDLTSSVQRLRGKAESQCGTLGGGNHFIEICLDTSNNVWLMLHSGSRNIGKELAEKHINIAKTLIHNESMEDKNFAVFLANTPEFNRYIHDLQWAQEYAFLNRQAMLFVLDMIVQEYFQPKYVVQVEKPILCHHNYVSKETHFGEDVYITRKGAISAKAGELGIIPGSMGAKSFIVRGLGNPDSFMSASHGAGRRMSRGEAKRKFTRKDLIDQTNGVECRKDSGVIDEIPGAYKSIDEVMKNQADLVEVVAQLKQILCVKG
jgi:tRNA-splicing ligase RtcB (3'-phosphate/5'-hydroxy nucleic acid ligase)